jgi:hypothetical protein
MNPLQRKYDMIALLGAGLVSIDKATMIPLTISLQECKRDVLKCTHLLRESLSFLMDDCGVPFSFRTCSTVGESALVVGHYPFCHVCRSSEC